MLIYCNCRSRRSLVRVPVGVVAAALTLGGRACQWMARSEPLQLADGSYEPMAEDLAYYGAWSEALQRQRDIEDQRAWFAANSLETFNRDVRNPDSEGGD